MIRRNKLPMKLIRTSFVLAAGFLILRNLGASFAAAQNLEPAQMLHPAADSWPMYHGDYSGRRHSSLTQINPENAESLGLAWAFQTGQTAQIKSSPLLVDGILYFTVPDNIWAVDARSGHLIRHFNHPTTEGDHMDVLGISSSNSDGRTGFARVLKSRPVVRAASSRSEASGCPENRNTLQSRQCSRI